MVVRCRAGGLSTSLEVVTEGDEEAEMLYLWGPGLETEVDHWRTALDRSAGAPRRWWQRVRQSVSSMGRDRPHPW